MVWEEEVIMRERAEDRADRYRNRAEELLSFRDEMKDAHTREIMQRLAEEYEQMARRAEQKGAAI